MHLWVEHKFKHGRARRDVEGLPAGLHSQLLRKSRSAVKPCRSANRTVVADQVEDRVQRRERKHHDGRIDLFGWRRHYVVYGSNAGSVEVWIRVVGRESLVDNRRRDGAALNVHYRGNLISRFECEGRESSAGNLDWRVVQMAPAGVSSDGETDRCVSYSGGKRQSRADSVRRSTPGG